jgi:fatty acid desaturase
VNAPQARQPVLRERSDLRSLAFVAIAVLLLSVPHLWRPDGWLAPAWILATAWACFIASIVSHNHLHCAVFARAPLNIAFNVALSLARGHSASGIVVPHNLNHHPRALRDEDWIRPALAGHGLGWVRLVRYVLRASANMLVQRRQTGAPALPSAQRTSLGIEKFLLAVWILGLAWSDWRVFLWFDVLPWGMGLALLVGVNLLQHDRCDPNRAYGESRNFTGAFGNWLFFNNGFHTVHHLDPGAHWSRLPRMHAALRDRLPDAELEQRSVLRYLWCFGWSRHPPPGA